jgi:hypothetical protein
MRQAQSRVVASPPPASIPVLYIEADGTGVPVRKSEAQGRKAKNGEGAAKTREVKRGAVFTQSALDAEGKPLRDPDSTSFVGTFQCSEDFGTLLRREAFARGYDRAEKTVVAKRFKNSGVFWSRQGAQNVPDLRTALLNNRLDSQWSARNQMPAMNFRNFPVFSRLRAFPRGFL